MDTQQLPQIFLVGDSDRYFLRREVRQSVPLRLEGKKMQPRMSAKELDLFTSFVNKSERYLEFGTGGSTFIASSHVKSWIVSVDSSQRWLRQVGDACASNRTKPELIFADIGATGDWGVPVDEAVRPRWRDYHSQVWATPKNNNADLYFVDGRFRVACFAQIVLHCEITAIIGFHDFRSRKQYHRVHEIAREIAGTEDISFFQPRIGAKEQAARILADSGLDPA